MRKSFIVMSMAATAGIPVIGSAQTVAPAPEHTVTGNVSLFSEYRFRGISQTFAKPAIQGGFDYSHASGVYLGNWNSNVSSGAGYPGGTIEMDLYGGWKKSLDDRGFDVGFVYYYYPDAKAGPASAIFTNPRFGKVNTGRVDNKEIYIGGSWKWLSAKYHYALDDYFSLPGTKGSNYLDISGIYELGAGWGLVGHVGAFRLKGWSTALPATNANYTDWKLGVTKDIAGWVFAASYIDSSAKGSCSAGEFYCFGNTLPAMAGTQFKDAGKGVIILSVSKSF